jgi:hypothetical protein
MGDDPGPQHFDQQQAKTAFNHMTTHHQDYRAITTPRLQDVGYHVVDIGAAVGRGWIIWFDQVR